MDVVYMSDTSQGENIEQGALTRRSLFARAETFGKTEGKGDNSRPGLFVLACEGARARVLSEVKRPDKTDDADELFARYSRSVSEGQGIGWKAQASAKQQTSKLRCAIKLGLLPQVNGMEVINATIEAQRAQRQANDGKNDYSPYDGLVKVARHQIQYPDAMLSKDVIEGLLIKPAAKELDEADKLEKVMKAATSLADKAEDGVSPESAEILRDVASTIMTRISDLGGSTAMRKQAAKADATTAQLIALTDMARERAAKAQAALQPVNGLTEYLAKRREGMVSA